MKAIAPFAALAVVSTLAHSDTLPLRKEGLWELVSTTPDSKRPPRTQRVCLDRETDALLNTMGVTVGKQVCSKNDVHVSGNRVTIHSVCDFGGSQLTSEGVITYSGDSSFRNEVHGHFQPAMAGVSETHTVQEGKWLGACPAGMKPGDLVTTVGASGREIKMNLRDMLGKSP
jgi:hypothetical protein